MTKIRDLIMSVYRRLKVLEYKPGVKYEYQEIIRNDKGTPQKDAEGRIATRTVSRPGYISSVVQYFSSWEEAKPIMLKSQSCIGLTYDIGGITATDVTPEPNDTLQPGNHQRFDYFVEVSIKVGISLNSATQTAGTKQFENTTIFTIMQDVMNLLSGYVPFPNGKPLILTNTTRGSDVSGDTKGVFGCVMYTMDFKTFVGIPNMVADLEIWPTIDIMQNDELMASVKSEGSEG